jgi:hypothetical protein
MPQLLDQAVARHDAAGVEHEQGKEHTRFAACQQRRLATVDDLERSQDADLHEGIGPRLNDFSTPWDHALLRHPTKGRTMRRIATAVAVVAACAALSAGLAGAITGGQPDGNGHPYVGVLVDDYETPGYYQRFCSGTLVAPRLLVTAAHCLLATVDSEIWVSFDPVYRPGISTLIHGTGIAAVDPARFRGNAGAAGAGGISDMGNDVAVVHLDETPPVDNFARLPTAGLLSTLALQGRTFTAVGYGRTRVDRTKGPSGIVPNFDPDVRNVALEEFRSLQPGVLTVSQNASTGDGGTCYGDSGGPTFLDDTDVILATLTLGDAVCRSLGRLYRLDTAFAREFLASQGVSVP